MYDVTKRSSFLGLQKWIEEVRRYTASNVMLVLIGKLFYVLYNHLESLLTLPEIVPVSYHSQVVYLKVFLSTPRGLFVCRQERYFLVDQIELEL